MSSGHVIFIRAPSFAGVRQKTLDELIGLKVSFVKSVAALHFSSDGLQSVAEATTGVLAVNPHYSVLVLTEELLDVAATDGRWRLYRWLLKQKSAYLVIPSGMCETYPH